MVERLRPRSAAVIAACALVSAGCGLHFPDPARIEDLRVLEIRTDPPEIAVFEPGGPPATTLAELSRLRPRVTPVKLTALVAHPDLKATFYYEWFRCAPAFQRLPCPTPPERQPLQDASTSSIAFISPIPTLVAELAATSSGTSSNPLSIFTDDPRDLLNGLYAFMNLRTGVRTASITVDTLALEAVKRLVIFDPQIVRVSILEARRRAAAGLGLPQIPGVTLPNLCTTASDEQLQKIYAFLDQRTPNRAPTFAAVRYARPPASVETEGVLIEPPATLKLRSGEQIDLRGYAAPGDIERYQAIDDNCELIDLSETLSWSWFVSAGSISRRVTIEGIREVNQAQQRTTYTAPLVAPNRTARARIWSVLRDGRGGSDLRVIDVEIGP